MGAPACRDGDRRILRGPRVIRALLCPAPGFAARLSEGGDLIVIDGPETVALAGRELERSAEQLYTEFVAQGELPAGLRRPYLAWDDLDSLLAAGKQLALGGLDIGAGPEGAVQPVPEFTPP